MRKLFTCLVLFICFSVGLYAQQDVQFTKYMFNSLVYNPAYSGAKDHMAITLLHRTQWWGIEGAPSSQSFTIHSPLKNDRLALGFSLVNDKIGPTQNTQAYITYAYRIPLGKNSKLSIGVQGGADRFAADYSRLNLEDGTDNAFADVEPRLLANFGGGVYYYNKSFYAGLGVPHLIEYDYRTPSQAESTSIIGRQYRHYYFTAGGAIPLNGDNLIFKPSVMVKNVGLDSKFRNDEKLQKVSAPTSIDLDLSLFFFKTLWIGGAYRTSFEAFQDKSSDDSFDVWAAYYLNNGLRIGAAYDFTVNELSSAAGGSFEVMLGYEFDYKSDKIVTPRYF